MQTRRAFVRVDHGRPTATTHQLNCAESLRTRTFRVTPPRELCDLSLVICPRLLIDLTKSLLSEAAEHGAQPEEVQLDGESTRPTSRRPPNNTKQRAIRSIQRRCRKNLHPSSPIIIAAHLLTIKERNIGTRRATLGKIC
jgi:hypothetical protein